MTYNLLKEKWIPVLYADGRFTSVGITEALTQASQIRQLAASNPMDRVSIFRFLLALLYWCRGNPDDKSTSKLGDSFPSEWFNNLEKYQEYFNLLGEATRFYQYKKSEPGGNEKLTANYLNQEIPTGTNLWHFKHATDERDGLCSACCARGLLRLPAFATSGGRGKPPGINAKPPVYVIPVGVTLAETLRLSWQKAEELGTPAWEKPDMELPKSGKVPLLTGLTWVPRRVWLDSPSEIAPCVSCGSVTPLIRKCVFASIGSQKDGDRIWQDPHTVFDGKGVVVKPGDALKLSDAASGQWTRILSAIFRRGDYKGHIWIIGFSTVQNDKYLEAMEYEIPFIDALYQVQDSIEKIERWQAEGKFKQIGKVLKSKGEGRAIAGAVRPHVEAVVSARASDMLTDDAVWESATGEYGLMMRSVAKSLAPGFTTKAVRQRKQIAKILPNMRDQQPSARKDSQKKGGE